MTACLEAATEAGVVRAAVAALRRAEPIVVLDDVRGAGTGLLVVAAEHATTDVMAFVVRHTGGFVRVALPAQRTAELALRDMMVPDPGSRAAALTVSADYVHGTTTGISARDRSLTAMAMVDTATHASDLTRPGHVPAVRVHDDGVLGLPAPAEAAVDLVRLAGLRPGAVLSELVPAEGTDLVCGTNAEEFAAAHGLVAVGVAALVAALIDVRLRSDALAS
ncbi:3,4-dihydroxy-2-butanone-4-phosphate synthase [Pseudonocardia sp. GCM10023141]|uniref:3,4-dihydroxy-2-butanone-4-phosphate synthase n=1 Tax=Pseudonocardia sp. GCM10023141 TaxID=3252653 RepID=UPI00360BA27F